MGALTRNPWLPHFALIGIIAVGIATGGLLLVPVALLVSALVLRSRMLVIAGFASIALLALLLVFAGVIGGSVEGGLVE
jgi:hypothetical protein